MCKQLKQMLLNEYQIQGQALQEIPAGWSAAAWKVHSETTDYFLKVYDKHKSSTKHWVARIDNYMPVVLWLSKNTELQIKMTAPILTKDNVYKKEDNAFVYMVFPFIEGDTLSNQRLNSQQIQELAQIIAILHSYGTEIPVPVNRLKETFDVSFCLKLTSWLKNTNHFISFKEPLSPYIKVLMQKIAQLQRLSDLLQKSNLSYTLCHTDIHGGNLIQSNNLILIDWEGLTLAPVEADLFSFTETFFYDYAWDDFMTIYCTAHQDYQINENAMKYYRLRRRLIDIYEFIESILFDNLSPDNITQTLAALKRECELLNIMET